MHNRYSTLQGITWGAEKEGNVSSTVHLGGGGGGGGGRDYIFAAMYRVYYHNSILILMTCVYLYTCGSSYNCTVHYKTSNAYTSSPTQTMATHTLLHPSLVTCRLKSMHWNMSPYYSAFQACNILKDAHCTGLGEKLYILHLLCLMPLSTIAIIN